MDGEVLTAVEQGARDAGERLTPDERSFLLKNSAAIIFEDDQGFVEVEWFKTREKARRKFQSIADDIEAETEEDDE